MVFSSPYFVFLFLPAALAACLPLRGRAYLWAILAVSIFFYFWSAGPDTLLLLKLIGGNYLGALLLTKWRSRGLFALLIVANAAVLLWYKYAAFIATNLDPVFGTQLVPWVGKIALPAGVSFFVFQAISYVSDVYRRDVAAEQRFSAYGAYQAFFPHLIAGPIVRFRDVIADLEAPQRSASNFAIGISRFAHGLLKKVVIADGVAPVANMAFSFSYGNLDCLSSWCGALAYTLQIYFDFSGYSDMAIGLARMFGIRFHENFERPYGSRSLTEFWRRWHISLSSWFRDYVYIPLGGNRGSTFTTYRNLLIVFALTGLWHGASWTFVLWGLYHGAFLVGERVVFREPAQALRHPALRHLYCLPVVILGWVLFRATTLEQCLGLWRQMLVPARFVSLSDTWNYCGLTPYRAGAMLIGASILITPEATSWGRRLMVEPTSAAEKTLSFAYTTTALVMTSILILTSGYSPFLYFNF